MKKVLIISVVLFLFGLFFFLKEPSIFIHLPGDEYKKVNSQLRLEKVMDIPLSGGANRLDYQSIDTNTHQLYISHLGSNMVHVFDLTTQKVVRDIPVSGSPYGILAVPSLKEVYVGIGSSDQVAVIDENTLKVTKYIQAGDTPDGMAYDAHTNQIFVSNENGGTVSVINAVTNKHVTDIRIGGAVGNSHEFAKQNRVYTTGGEDNVLAEIDPTTNTVINKYPLKGCSHPHGFYIDPPTSYAFITCDVNNVMVVFDLNSEKILLKDSVGAGPDVLAYDGSLHNLYVAAESGIITIFSVQKGNVKKIYEGFIAPHAHTVSVDQGTHYLYLPLENINGKPELRVYKPL